MKRQIQGLWSPVLKPGLTSWGRRRAGTRWDTPEGTASSGPHPRSPCTWRWRRAVTVGPARCRTRRTATTLLQTPRSFEALILCQGPNKRWFKGLRKLIVVPITLGCWMLDLRKGVSVHGGFLDYQPVYLLRVIFKKGVVLLLWVKFNNLSVSHRIHSYLRY